MTIQQYRRLAVVAFLPLLLAGWIYAVIFEPFGEGPFVTCEYDDVFQHNCRSVGWAGGLHDEVLKSSPAWFDLQIPHLQDESPVSIHFQGSARSFYGAQVISATPYGSNAGDVGSNLVGRQANVILGLDGDQRSYVSSDNLVLYCNSLNFEVKLNEYRSNCFGDDWAQSVSFALVGDGREHLNALKKAMIAEIDDNAARYRGYQLLMYPLFVYLFMLLSGLAWLTNKAYRFVKAG